METNYFKENRGLFVFSDPGGAKPLLAFIENNKLNKVKVISDRNYEFFSNFKTNVCHFKNENIENIIKNFNPAYLFTGTSYTSKIELKFIQVAKKLNIKSYSFIDHYTRFKERFYLEGIYIFPEKIFVIDNKAKKIAINQGLHKKSKLIISGNFYLKFLKNWMPNINRKNLLIQKEILPDEKIILFAPDPVSNLNWKKKFNFDETSLWKTLSKIINKKLSIKNLIVLVKLHPNQKKNYLKNVIFDNKIKNFVIVDSTDVNSLIYYSDVIIGMFSSILIEANVFNKKILRFLPPNVLNDPLESLNIGEKCNNEEELFKYLKNIL